jgi:tetratricopeptide (TPR) repeat protein
MTPPADTPPRSGPRRGAVRHPGRALAALLALLLAASAAPPRAAAEQPNATAVAKKHFYRGEKLFALGRFRDALAAYERAFEAEPLPELLFNIGQCHRNLGDYRSAVFSFRKYLRLVPEADNREAVEKLIGELEAEMKRADAEARARARASEPDPAARALRPSPSDKADKPGSPLYKRWWFWTGIVALGAGGTAAVLLSRDSGLPESDLGNWDFSR